MLKLNYINIKDVKNIKNKNGKWNKNKRKNYSKQQALERLGQTRTNNYGDIMWIIEYIDSTNISVQFMNGYVVKNKTYQEFCSGSIKNPNSRSVYGHGYIGVGKYKAYTNGEQTNLYAIWHSMLQRCFSKKFQEKNPTYKDCTISEEFLNFQYFCQWYNLNYYDVGESRMEVDKDILLQGNKIYSPNTCVLVPQNINVLITKSDAKRGNLPIGVDKYKDRFRSRCNIGNGEKKYLGLHDTPEEAFNVYKEFKENRIKKFADKYKDKLPKKLYDALYKYKIEITD